jgi:hypothetical protein
VDLQKNGQNLAVIMFHSVNLLSISRIFAYFSCVCSIPLFIEKDGEITFLHDFFAALPAEFLSNARVICPIFCLNRFRTKFYSAFSSRFSSFVLSV